MAANGSPVPRPFRVLLQVADLRRSRRFYESLLGARGRSVGGGRIYFDCGSVILALLDPTEDGLSKVGVLPEPLYFSTPDLDRVFARATRLGCLSPALIHNDPFNPAGEIVVRPWGERSFYAADPSGNPLCFVESSTLFTGRATRGTNSAGRPKGGRETSSRSASRRPVRR
jgi:catechol 2,3-dioxygenase-like lactoylglutathione lyase family enzyme